jgi:hypothetical protein
MRDSANRLLLNALLKGLGHVIRRDDLFAAERYRRRLHLTAETIASNAPVKGALAKLLVINGLWLQAADVERSETRQQILNWSISLLACTLWRDGFQFSSGLRSTSVLYVLSVVSGAGKARTGVEFPLRAAR